MTAATPAVQTRRWDDAWVAALLALLAFGLAAGELLWRADRPVYDFAMALWPVPAADDVVLVAIDDDSIDAIGRWPWPRSVHATLLDKLAPAKPRALLLDLVLSEPAPDPAHDALLAQQLRAGPPVVLTTGWQLFDGAVRAVEPVPVLREAVRLGASEGAVDDDGVLRAAFLQSSPPGRPLPHAALALLQAGGEQVHPGLAVDRAGGAVPAVGLHHRDGRFLIRFGGPPGHLRQVSYADLLFGKVPASVVAGRYVLVGMTGQGVLDTVATPVNGLHRTMPGVEVLAHTLQTLRLGNAPQAVSPRVQGLLSGLGVALLVAAFVRAGTRLALLLAVLSWPLALAGSVLALKAGWWFGPVPFLVAAVLAYPLWSWRRLERGLKQLDREIARLAVEPGLLPPTVSLPASTRRDRLALRLAALHNAAETLRSARRFLADALAGLPTALLVDDGQGRVLLANALAAPLFDLDDADDLQGLDLARLLAEFETQPAQDWPQVLATLREGGADHTVQARREGRHELLVHAHGAPMHGGVRVIVALTDIAVIKQAERAREELLAFVSHDLRSPATSIALLAELELAGRGTLPPRELLAEVQRLARRTLLLADDFVRVAQAAQRPLQREPANLAELLAEVVADMAPQAAAAGVHLVCQGDDPAVPTLFALDRALVARALGNLLSNAIKHSPAGAEVALALRPAEQAGECRFLVADQGRGLAPEAVQRLLQAHDGLVPTGSRGVGFGLLFVQRVAQRHGGHLGVQQGADGRGAVFELVIGGG